jgi:hypothetical protein
MSISEKLKCTGNYFNVRTIFKKTYTPLDTDENWTW